MLRSTLVLSLLTFTLAVPSAEAATTSIPVTVDADALSTDGFVTIDSTTLGPGFLDVSLFPDRERRSVLEFDISTLPAPGDIVSASLVLYITDANLLIGVHAGAGDGVVTDGDFQFSNQITTFDPTGGNPDVENVVDVTSYILSVAGVDAGAVFQLRELFNDEFNTIRGTGFGDPTRHPRLDITTIPEPAPLALLLLAAVTLVASRASHLA